MDKLKTNYQENPWQSTALFINDGIKDESFFKKLS